MIDNEQIAMIVGASAALAYRRKNPSADSEEIIKHIVSAIELDRDTKVFGVAAANFVAKYTTLKPQATEREVMQSLTNEIPILLNFIKNEM